jgi:hypothetical protein
MAVGAVGHGVADAAYIWMSEQGVDPRRHQELEAIRLDALRSAATRETLYLNAENGLYVESLRDRFQHRSVQALAPPGHRIQKVSDSNLGDGGTEERPRASRTHRHKAVCPCPAP